VAKKYENTYTARSNQFQITDDYDLAADDLISFAASQGWVDEGLERINFRAVYGGTTLYPDDNENLKDRPATEILYNTEVRYRRAMELLRAIDGAISAEAILPLVRDHYDTYTLPSGAVLELNQVPFYSSGEADLQEWITQFPEKDTFERTLFPRAICHHAFEGITASSAILVARPEIPNELGYMLHCFMQPCNSLFIPFYVGASSVDSRFATPEAARLFMILSVFDPYEKELFPAMAAMEKEYRDLLAAGRGGEARNVLDAFSDGKGAEGIDRAQMAVEALFSEVAASSAWSRD
jgi:dipeptidase